MGPAQGDHALEPLPPSWGKFALRRTTHWWGGSLGDRVGAAGGATRSQPSKGAWCQGGAAPPAAALQLSAASFLSAPSPSTSTGKVT